MVPTYVGILRKNFLKSRILKSYLAKLSMMTDVICSNGSASVQETSKPLMLYDQMVKY